MQENQKLYQIAERLDEAARNATAVEQLSETIDTAEAYEVQRLSIKRRVDRGEKSVGIKMGLTSEAKMAQMGLTDMIWGRLTDGMALQDGGEMDSARFIHPRVEPEIAFRLKAPLEGDITDLEALSAIDGVSAAVEIIDSRFKNFKFRITDVIADNSSSSAFVVGPWHRPDVDFSNLQASLELDGRPAQIGSSAAILGHPIRSLVAAARLLALREQRLEAGDIVLAGAITAAEPLHKGMKVQARLERLGQCCFTVI
jgi:2-oxo-3-hexenedioate decarboxylase